MTTRSIAVIGAGIVGVQIARALQGEGYTVDLYERAGPGQGTSFGNAGYMAIDEIFPLAHGRVLRRLPRMLFDPRSPLSVRASELPRLVPWLARYARACSTARARTGIDALARLQRHAGRAWRDVVERDGLLDLVRAHGALEVFESPRAFAANAGERAEQRARGHELIELNAEQIVRRVPELGRRGRHAIYYPRALHTVSPLALTEAILARFLAEGGRVHALEVTRLDVDSSGSVKLWHRAGCLDAPLAVVATGHASARLLEPLGYRVPLVAERGYHVEVVARELGFDLPVGFHERGFYMTPMRSGLRLAGTTEFVSAAHEVPPNWARADILLRHLRELMPSVNAPESSRWMGARPTLPDFVPVIGRAPRHPRLLLAFGHQHLGLTLSAITAEAIAALAGGRSPPFDLSAYDLARFA